MTDDRDELDELDELLLHTARTEGLAASNALLNEAERLGLLDDDDDIDLRTIYGQPPEVSP